MPGAASLDEFLAIAARVDPLRAPVAALVREIAAAGIALAAEIAAPRDAAPYDAAADGPASRNRDGDVQKPLDLLANEMFLAAARRAPVAAVASEELADPLVLDAQAPLALAIDPLDGSSNIETNLAVGTIFSIRPAGVDAPCSAFASSGEEQLAAGFLLYGPQTALVLTLGAGTRIFVLDRAARTFRALGRTARIPERTAEYAINASNYRFWHDPVRAYVDDLVQGADGPRGTDFNMRWIASLVAEVYRILLRGGIFLYPADQRPGYECGRLRLLYEAHPIAFLVEQAGGAATDGVHRILDLAPATIHQRVPLVFGSADKVARLARYHSWTQPFAERAPLFGRRGLLRA